jgi:hypothetical protein
MLLFNEPTGNHDNHQLNWPPRYNWNIVESDVKHHNPNLQIQNCLYWGYYYHCNKILTYGWVLTGVHEYWCNETICNCTRMYKKKPSTSEEHEAIHFSAATYCSLTIKTQLNHMTVTHTHMYMYIFELQFHNQVAT